MEEEDPSGNKKPPYIFDYKPGHLPAKTSKSRDYWGYYNSKSNSSLVPEFVWGTSTYGGDREVNKQTVGIGVLTKITYPTGGYTVFDYSPNEYRLSTPLYKKVVKRYAVQATGNQNCPFADCQENLCTGQDDTDTKIFTYSGVTASSVHLNISYPRSEAFKFCLPCQVDIKLTKVSDGSTVFELANVDPTKAIPFDYAYNLYTVPTAGVILTNGESYKLETTVSQCNSDIRITGDLSWEENGTEIDTYNGLAAGLRIKTVTDNDGVSTLEQVTHYDYSQIGSPGITSGKLVNGLPSYFKVIKKYKSIPPAETSNPWEQTISCTIPSYCEFSTFYTVNQSSIGMAGFPIMYTNVTVYKGAEGKYELGKTEYGFEFADDDQGYESPFIPSISNSWKRGQLAIQRDYKYDNGNFILQSEIDNGYTTKVYTSIRALAVNRELNRPDGFCTGIIKKRIFLFQEKLFSAHWKKIFNHFYFKIVR